MSIALERAIFKVSLASPTAVVLSTWSVVPVGCGCPSVAATWRNHMICRAVLYGAPHSPSATLPTTTSRIVEKVNTGPLRRSGLLRQP